MNEIALRVKEARAIKGVTQKELAKRVGVTKQTISNIETGTRGLTLRMAILIGEALSVSHEYLMNGGEKEQPLYTGFVKSFDQTKSISQQIQDIAEEICNKYCKYPDTWNEEKEGCELCDSDICANCPLGRL